MNNAHLYLFSDANRSDTENMTVCQTVNSFPSTATWKATHQIVACSLSFQASPPLLHSALIAATCSHHEHHPPQASPADVQSLFTHSNPNLRSASEQKHVWDSCLTVQDGFHIKSKFETQVKKCTSKSKQTHPARFLSVRVIIYIDRLFNFFQGEVLWLLPTNTANHLCQPNSPPACPQLFSLFLAGSMQPQSWFLVLTHSIPFFTELWSQR